jgi:hypothetical protein
MLSHKEAHQRVAAFYEEFVAGSQAKGVHPKLTEKVFGQLQAFGDYAFQVPRGGLRRIDLPVGLAAALPPGGILRRAATPPADGVLPAACDHLQGAPVRGRGAPSGRRGLPAAVHSGGACPERGPKVRSRRGRHSPGSGHGHRAGGDRRAERGRGAPVWAVPLPGRFLPSHQAGSASGRPCRRCSHRPSCGDDFQHASRQRCSHSPETTTNVPNIRVLKQITSNLFLSPLTIFLRVFILYLPQLLITILPSINRAATRLPALLILPRTMGFTSLYLFNSLVFRFTRALTAATRMALNPAPSRPPTRRYIEKIGLI